MNEQWQTIEQAAVTLGLSVRTVNRHITAGKLQSRLFEGRREVLVESPSVTPASMPTPVAAGGFDNGNKVESRQNAGSTATVVDAPSAPPSESVSVEPGKPAIALDDPSLTRPTEYQTLLALADSVDDKASLAVAAYQTLARSSEQQVQSLRRVALGAWASVAFIVVGIIVAVGWVAHRLTSSDWKAEQAATELTHERANAEQLSAARDRALDQVSEQQEQLQQVQMESAQLKGKMAALERDNQRLADQASKSSDTLIANSRQIAEQGMAIASQAAAAVTASSNGVRSPASRTLDATLASEFLFTPTTKPAQ